MLSFRKAKAVIIFVLGILLLLTGCIKEPAGPEQDLPGGNQDNPGQPYYINVPSINDTDIEVHFAIITDTHIDATYAGWWFRHDHDYRDTDKVKRNRWTIDWLNRHLSPERCFVVHIGDMVDANNTQNLVAFRQLYENDYPGHSGGSIAGARDSDYNAYSCGYRIGRPVFPTLGNHDVPPYDDSPEWWDYPTDYVRQRIENASIIASYYDNGAYIWRYGMYYFIVLGLWAGAGNDQSTTYIDYDRLTWLKDFLATNVGDSEIGLLIFQHYGWDGFSTDGRWWSPKMRELELDVLCRREWDVTTYQAARPYNVIAIFTGHDHSEHHIRVFAGLDAQFDSVFFDNIVCNDGGASGNYGYYLVDLYGDSIGVDSDHIWRYWTHWGKRYCVGS